MSWRKGALQDYLLEGVMVSPYHGLLPEAIGIKAKLYQLRAPLVRRRNLIGERVGRLGPLGARWEVEGRCRILEPLLESLCIRTTLTRRALSVLES